MVDDEIHYLEEYASNNNIPIMQKEGINFILEFIEKNKIKNILEIGTAIGYSAIRMALVSDDIKIISIERDKERYLEAVKNIKKLNLENRITVLFKDALETTINDKFDLILIDAAKAQNKKIFLKYENNLYDGGYIITDILKFHGYVDMDIKEIKSKNIRGLVKKITAYIQFLKENNKYETSFYELGDGLSISRRK